MSIPGFLLIKFKKWKQNHYIKNKPKFNKLSNLGQSPKSMIISCCDSRVLETHIFGANPGDFFIHKNIANLIPPHNKNKTNSETIASIEFAVKKLKVSHIIILGHSKCGGIEKLSNLDNKKNNELKYLYNWVKNAKPALKQNELQKNNKNYHTILEQESIKNSINNLKNFPFINNKKIHIHGLWYDIKNGNLMYLDKNKFNFKKIDY